MRREVADCETDHKDDDGAESLQSLPSGQVRAPFYN